MASTSDESDEAVWQRQLKSPVDPQVRLEPDKWRTKQHRGDKDPRKFEFAIVCMHCHVHRNSLGSMKVHLDYCPHRKRPDLLCGHCEFRVNHWPTMVRHLNRKDMERQLPCDPKYKMDIRVTKLFPTDFPKYRHCALKVLGHESRKQKFKQKYNAWLDMHPTDIKSFRKEAAHVRRGDPTATFQITPARYSTENSPCDDIVAQAVQIAQIGESSSEQSPGTQTLTMLNTDEQGGGVVAFMDDAPPTFNVSRPPLIALGSSLSDHSDVEPDDSTSLAEVEQPVSISSIIDTWACPDSRSGVIFVDTSLRQSCLPNSSFVETVSSCEGFVSQSAPINILSWQHSSPQSGLISFQPTVIPNTSPLAESLLQSAGSVTPQLSSLVSSSVVSGEVVVLGEIRSEPITQPVMLSQPELDVELEVPAGLISTPVHSDSTKVLADHHGNASSCVHKTLEKSVVAADADSSTDTETTDISAPVQPSTVVIKTEEETITLSSSEGEDTVGISTISDVTALRRQVSELRRQRQRDLRQLVFWSDTVAKLGAEMDRPPSESEIRARGKLISSGDWPSYMESIKTASFRKLGGRFADFYRGSLHSLTE